MVFRIDIDIKELYIKTAQENDPEIKKELYLIQTLLYYILNISERIEKKWEELNSEK